MHGHVFRFGALTAGALLLAASPAAAGTGWNPVPMPPTGQNAQAVGVSADSDSDAWAIGRIGVIPTQKPFVDHWNGSSWQQVPGPAFRSTVSVYYHAVSTYSPTDAWLVGLTSANKAISPLTAHWDGTSWQAVNSTALDGDTDLSGVVDLSPKDAWAVGENSALARSILGHWDGSTWTSIDLPDPNPVNPGLVTSLQAIAAVSPTDIWAIGTYEREAPDGFFRNEDYALHYDGSTWKVVYLPLAPGGDQNAITVNSITAIGPSDVWAVGQDSTTTVTEHWNGTAWSIVPSPSTSGTDPVLAGVSARSSTDVWAVGHTTRPSYQNITLHWDGTAWTTQPTPNPGSSNALLGTSTFPGAAKVWAVGYSGSSGSSDPLALEHP